MKTLVKYCVEVQERGKPHTMLASFFDKKDADNFAAYYRRNKYKYPLVKQF